MSNTIKSLTSIFIGPEVTLQDMMKCREQRVIIQNQLLKDFSAPLLSFTLNIPGPIKTNETLEKVFQAGLEKIKKTFTENNIVLLKEVYINEITGNEYICAFKAAPEKIKDLTIEIESTHPLGRLFDIDILNEQGQKLSRSKYRTCLICSKQAQECARNRTHSIEEMQIAILKLIEHYHW